MTFLLGDFFFTKKVEIENKTPVITDLVTKTALNTKAEEIENKVHSTISFISFLNLRD